MEVQAQADRVAFGEFEIDPRAGELWRGARKVRCQRQPFRVLCALLERPGEVVTREQLQREIWGSETPADADHSLGIAINKLREALGDAAENPRFVETLSRRGYRFIAPVVGSLALVRAAEADSAALLDPPFRAEAPVSSPVLLPTGESPGEGAAAPFDLPAPTAPAALPERRSRRFTTLAAGGVVLLLLGALAGFLLDLFLGPRPAAPHRIEQITHSDSIFPGVPAMESFPVIASDGSRLYSSILDNGRTEIASIDPQTGESQPLAVPSEIVNPLLSDISSDGSRLLVRSHPSSDSEQPLWVVPRDGGSALRVGSVLAHDAVWMPDGESVLYATGDDLYIVHLTDGSSTHYATLPGRAFRMRWSPGGKVLRFTLLDPLAHTSSLWQIKNGGVARPLLEGWTRPAAECCGVWSSDGKDFVFQSFHEAGSDLWVLRGRARTPQRLTDGPLLYTAPAPERGERRIFFVGLDTRSELQRFDAATHRFAPEAGFLADASRVSYSRDRQWVAWIDGSGHLWRARAADGTEKVQLTTGDLEVFLARWSPDGRRLIVMGRAPGHTWQLFLVSADGGAPQAVLHEKRNEADPTWSPDGTQIAFGRTSDLMGREPGPKQIHILNLASGAVTALPGSDGLFSPRWSPDGRWIAALTLGEQRLMFYDTQTRLWQSVSGGLRGADPVWATDGSGLYIHQAFANPQTIDRVAVPGEAVTRIATLTGPLASEKADYVFVGIARDDAPLVRVRTATANLYALTLAH